MNTAWSIYSGGRWNNQMVEDASFRIIIDDAPDSILLRSVSVKQAFANKLKRQLSGLAAHDKPVRSLSIAIQSAVVVGETGRLEVELSVEISEDESDSMLWYFMLRSLAVNISPDNLDEIVVLIINRLCPSKMNNKHKACL
jgi:hypothetical protein